MLKKITIAIVILAAISVAVFFVSGNSSSDYERQQFYIEKGDGIRQVADKLEERGIVDSANGFYLYAAISGKGKNLVPGNHMLDAGLKISEIIERLSDAGNINAETSITVLEGWSIDDIAKYLEENGLADGEEFKEAADISLWRDKYAFLEDKKIRSLEGFLFPDTYRIFVGSSPEKIIARMLDNFQAKLDSDMSAKLESRGLSLYQAIIMASIIEKEARSASDKRVVSGIFWNRYDIGMGLQSDATINYLTGKGETRSKGADLEIDSPYNTYKYRGLPPGPICSPGFDALYAAIYPQDNDYLYFITDASGRAVFAKTYDEHLANVAKYLD